MCVCVNSWETVFRTEKLKERIGNLRQNECSIQILFFVQIQYIHSTTCTSKKASVCNGLYYATTFSDMCTNWNIRLINVTQYNLSLALFPELPVDPLTTCAVLSSHWVYNNRDGNSSLL